MEIYMAGITGRQPSLPLDPDELEQRAKAVLPARAYVYVAGGAGGDGTVRANRAAFERYRIMPRHLRDVANRDLGIELFGQRLPAPIILAPIGVQSMLHADAELAVARAARSLGMPLVLSSVSSTPLEAVAEALGDSLRLVSALLVQESGFDRQPGLPGGEGRV